VLDRRLQFLKVSLVASQGPIVDVWRDVRRAIDCNFQSAAASSREALCDGVIGSIGPIVM
jgi:hypothetical protein